MPLTLNRLSFLAAGTAAMISGRASAADRNLDIAQINARVWTGRRGQRSDAIGIVGNRIVALGADAVKAATGTRTKVIDLQGAFAMLAFTDCHTHFLRGAAALLLAGAIFPTSALAAEAGKILFLMRADPPGGSADPQVKAHLEQLG